MKKFKLTALVTVSVYTTVEANSIEEAKEIAQDRGFMSISSNGGDTENDSWICEELDGFPNDINEE